MLNQNLTGTDFAFHVIHTAKPDSYWPTNRNMARCHVIVHFCRYIMRIKILFTEVRKCKETNKLLLTYLLKHPVGCEAQLAAQQYKRFLTYKPSKLGQTDLVSVCEQSSSVGFTGYATCQTKRELLTGYTVSSAS